MYNALTDLFIILDISSMHHVGRVARKVTFAQCNNPVSAIAQSNKCTVS